MIFLFKRINNFSRKASSEATIRKGVIDKTKVTVMSNAQILRNQELYFNKIGKPFTNNSVSKLLNKGTKAKSGHEESCSNCASPKELKYLLFKIEILQTVLFARLYILQISFKLL